MGFLKSEKRTIIFRQESNKYFCEIIINMKKKRLTLHVIQLNLTNDILVNPHLLQVIR